MNTVNNLLEGANPYKALQNEAGKLAGKWRKSGLLEGIASSTEKNNMAILLENQAKQLVNEANSTGTGAEFTAGNSEAWAGVALPLVRRVFGEIVAKDLVSVQPMNLPAGLIFYLDFQYGSSDNYQAAGDSLYAASTDLTKTEIPATGTNSGLYGAGTFGYSINSASATLHVTGGVEGAEVPSGDLLTTTGGGAWGTESTASYGSVALVESASFNFDEEFISNNTLTGIDRVRISTASLTDFDPEAVRAYKIQGKTNYNQFNTYNKAGGYIEMYVLGSDMPSDNANDSIVVSYYKGPDNLNDVGDFEEGKGGVSNGFAGNGSVSTMNIPEINVQLKSDTVAAKTRKLKAQWTPEFAQDLNAYHSIDAEAELTSILSEYISMEIDLEILDMLISNADTTEHWSVKIGEEVNSSGAVTTAAGTAGTYYTKMSWFQTLGVKLQKVSNLIHQKTLRGGANFMVVSPKISTILESIPGFAADSAGDKDKYAMGVQKVGAINSRYDVYKNPYLTENVILMGYKGSQFLETGAVFSPYIPLIMTPLVYDPVSFTPRKGIMTRYAKKMVRPDFYGKVLVHHLDEV
jgi:hypothetical protein